MTQNCSEIVQEIVYNDTANIDNIDILLAINYLCDMIRSENTTVITKYFKEACCTDHLLLQFCHEFAGFHLNLSLDLNCSELPIHPPHNMTSFYYAEDHFDIMTYVLMAVLLPIGIAGNALILYAILKMRCLPYQTGYFLSSLAVADLGVITEFIAFFIYHKNDAYVPNRLHQFLVPSIGVFFGAISLMQITCISIERAVAVTWPLKYPSYVSIKRAKLIVHLVWLFSFNLVFLGLLRVPITLDGYSLFVFYLYVVILLLMPMTVVIIAYTFVFISAYQNLTQERRRLKMLTFLIKNNDIIAEHDGEKKLAWKASSIRCKEIKLSINVAMVVVPFLVAWGFFFFVNVYEFETGHRFTGVYNWLITVLPFCVSTMNPMLYLIFTRSLRNAVKSVIKRKVRQRMSRTELSIITLSSNNGNNSRRASSVTYNVPTLTGGGRKIGRDFSYLMAPDIEEEELVSNPNCQ